MSDTSITVIYHAVSDCTVNTLKIGPQQVCYITLKAEQNSVEKSRLN